MSSFEINVVQALRSIDNAFREQNRILTALNQNLVTIGQDFKKLATAELEHQVDNEVDQVPEKEYVRGETGWESPPRTSQSGLPDWKWDEQH